MTTTDPTITINDPTPPVPPTPPTLIELATAAGAAGAQHTADRTALGVAQGALDAAKATEAASHADLTTKLQALIAEATAEEA